MLLPMTPAKFTLLLSFTIVLHLVLRRKPGRHHQVGTHDLGIIRQPDVGVVDVRLLAGERVGGGHNGSVLLLGHVVVVAPPGEGNVLALRDLVIQRDAPGLRLDTEPTAITGFMLSCQPDSWFPSCWGRECIAAATCESGSMRLGQITFG